MAKSDTNKNPAKGDVQEPGRRDFIVVATYAMAGLGAAAVAWPLIDQLNPCLLYTSPSPRDRSLSRMPSSA